MMGESEEQVEVKIVLSENTLSKENRKEGVPEVTKSTGKKNKLDIVLPPARPRSPVTVQEWIASLPDKFKNDGREESTSESSDDEEVSDTLTLGAEAGRTRSESTRKLTAARQVRIVEPSDKRTLLQHSDTAASFRSNLSALSTCSSVSDVLFARAADPEEVLHSLGFVGCDTLARIPARFLTHQSRARGVSVENYLARQEDIITRQESGAPGFRGIQGCPTRVPSNIVEKILQTLKESENELRRKHSVQSFTSTTSYGAASIPARFQIFDNKHTLSKNVGHVSCNTRTNCIAIADHVSHENVNEKVLNPDTISDNEISDVTSIDVSDDSDWSDEEKERYEKIFGKISERAVQSKLPSGPRKSRRESRRNRKSIHNQ